MESAAGASGNTVYRKSDFKIRQSDGWDANERGYTDHGLSQHVMLQMVMIGERVWITG